MELQASSRGDAAARQRGYSFLEVVAVILVVGIMAAFAVKPMRGLFQRIKLQGAANGVKHLIMTARLRAVANPDRHCGVVFRMHGSGPADDSVFAFLETSPADKLYTKGRDSLYLAPFVVNREDRIVTAIPAGYPGVIVFRGDGSASASAKIVLTLGTLQDTVDVLASTGRVKVVVR